MPKIAKPLSALEVRVLRTMVGSRRASLGLGGYPTVTLAQATCVRCSSHYRPPRPSTTTWRCCPGESRWLTPERQSRYGPAALPAPHHFADIATQGRGLKETCSSRRF